MNPTDQPLQLKRWLIEALLKDPDVREAMQIATRRAEWDRMLSYEEDSSSRLLKRLEEALSLARDKRPGTPECSGGEDQ